MSSIDPEAAAAKRRICTHQCPHPCADFLAGKIDFDDMTHSCPVDWPGGWVGISTTPTVPPPSLYHKLTQAAATWGELHRYVPAHDPAVDLRWLADFSNRVRGSKCSCQSNWMTWVHRNPPRWDDWFAWTVESHNDVNRRLGKPILTVEQARAIWPPEPAIVPTV